MDKKPRLTMIQKSFLGFFAFFFTLLFCCSFFVLWYKISKSRSEYYIQVDTAISQMQINLANKLSGIFDSAVGLFSTDWYFHWRNPYLNKNDYHILRRKEISSELNIIIAPLEVVHDFLIVTPAMDSVISRLGWYTLEDYTNYYRLVDFRYDENGGVIPTILDIHYALLAIPDIYQHESPGIIYVLIDKRNFSQYISRMTNTRLSYVRIETDSSLLYEAGDADVSNTQTRQITKGMHTTMTFCYPSYMDLHLTQDLANCLLGFILIVALAAGVAMLLSQVTIKPLQALLTRLSGVSSNSLKDAYCAIAIHMDDIHVDNVQLRKEKRQLSDSLHRFHCMLENEVLLGLLTNPDFDYADEHVLASMPGIADALPFSLTLLSPRTPDAAPLFFDEGAALCNDIKILKLIDKEVCLITWFNPSVAEQRHETFRQWLLEAYDQSYFVLSSHVMQQIGRASACYLSMHNDLDRVRRNTKSLPISMQIELLSKILSHKSQEAYAIAQEARNSCDGAMFLQLLEQIVYEYRLDDEGLARKCRQLFEQDLQDKAWEKALILLNKITFDVNFARRSNDLIVLIRQFINDNYTHPDMSIKLLSSHFQIGGSLISRVFKADTGLNFSEYLLNLRMKLAIALLSESNLSIVEIANQVGYDNYTTFKRAFIRYKGVSPREFRLNDG